MQLNYDSVLDEKLAKIHLITQYFIPQNENRKREIDFCLQKNIENPFIDQIHLLNEQIYSFDHIFTPNTPRMVQTNMEKRLSFKHILEYIRKSNIEGFIVVSNADIFFDDGLRKMKYTTLPFRKEILALLRWEYSSQITDLGNCPLFGPRADSQDTWIFHTSMIKEYIAPRTEKLLDIVFGKLGCDNKIAYIFKIMGFDVINDPLFIRTYHYHESSVRTYTTQDRYSPPYVSIFPARTDIEPQLQTGLSNGLTLNYLKFDEGNSILREYISAKLEKKEAFIIPRIARSENMIAFIGELYKLNGNRFTPEQINYMSTAAPKMKTNTGVYIPDTENVVKYSQMYLKAFENCEIYTAWESWGSVYKNISASHDFISQKYHQKQSIWAYTYDIFHHIYKQPFTHSFHGKRLLIISMFENSFRQQIEKRNLLYDGIDLFPDCEFLFIKPPMTHGNTLCKDFGKELEMFYRRLDVFKGKYDVALLSCGGYGNLICNYIYENHKSSAIYVGGVLQMWFGVYGQRWLEERPEILKLFMNEHWKRPSLDERPDGFSEIENGCYW